MTGDDIRRIGRALFGNSWKYPFEVQFSISGRKLQRILAGDEFVGPAMKAKITAALVSRRAELGDILENT